MINEKNYFSAKLNMNKKLFEGGVFMQNNSYDFGVFNVFNERLIEQLLEHINNTSNATTANPKRRNNSSCDSSFFFDFVFFFSSITQTP
jgi:hypothetical protein